MLKNCWELLNCGRQKNGEKVAEFGECIASKEQLGHSCWALDGTLCGGMIQGDSSDKRRNCMTCEVFKMYHRTTGEVGKKIKDLYQEEEEKFNNILLNRMGQKYK